MGLGLLSLSLAGAMALLARAVFVVVLLGGLAVPLIHRTRSLRPRKSTEADDSVDLHELWELYRRGEISWDVYLRGEVEGKRGLAGTKADPSRNPAPDDAAS